MFKYFRWQDILDILIVAYIIYRVLLLIKGTRAVQMIVGIVLIFLVFLVADLLKLHTLYWIIQSLWAQVVLALIILFQPEIRRALARMGQTPILPTLTTASEAKSFDEIVRAAISLANKKIGALIVLERENPLTELVEVGTPLDAKVTKELLLSIFHPTSPIHDGAVVIRGDRVVAAGCFLPISLRSDLSKNLGTRHRAAIGLTEESDAIVIVVSEETGLISVAESGRLETPMDMGTLMDYLTEAFSQKKKKWEAQ